MRHCTTLLIRDKRIWAEWTVEACFRMLGSLDSKLKLCCQSVFSQWLVALSGLGSGITDP